MASIGRPPPAPGTLLRGRRALVVEASRRVRLMLREVVSGFGPDQVVSSDNATDALDDLRAERFDLIVCGQVPGPGYDTVTLIERIRTLGLIPRCGTLVVLTPSRTTRDVVSLAAQAPDLCLIRPIGAAELAQRLRATLEEKVLLEPVVEAIEAGDVRASIERTLALGPGRTELKRSALRMVCEDQLERRDTARAEEVLELAAAFGDAPWMTLAQARIRTLQGQEAQALALLERLVSDRPEFIASYDALASIEADLGAFPSAVRHLEEANARAGFSVSRFRRTGALAIRSGDLGLAESALDRLLGRVERSELAEGADYVAMVDVLAARGKLERAGQVARELQRNHSYCPDSSVLLPLVVYRRRVEEGGDPTAALETLLQALEKAGPEVSVETRLQVLEACLEQGLRREALAIARAIALSGRADRFRLGRVRALLERAPDHAPG